jgi:hypothetical protein
VTVPKLRHCNFSAASLVKTFSPKRQHSDTAQEVGRGGGLPSLRVVWEELRKQRQLWLHTRQYKTQLFDKI